MIDDLILCYGCDTGAQGILALQNGISLTSLLNNVNSPRLAASMLSILQDTFTEANEGVGEAAVSA